MYKLYKVTINGLGYLVICTKSNKALYVEDINLKNLSNISEAGYSTRFIDYSILNHICDIESYEDLVTNYPEHLI